MADMDVDALQQQLEALKEQQQKVASAPKTLPTIALASSACRKLRRDRCGSSSCMLPVCQILGPETAHLFDVT